MGNQKQTLKKTKQTKKANNLTFAAVVVITVLIIVFIIIKITSGGLNGSQNASDDLKILKSEVTETAKIYPYKAGKTNMEVLAVKATDGTIRTAFNTCQVCFDSGRGYYKQQGDDIICQNCGNRFHIDQIEMKKGGCNPVPITAENKTDNETSIIISKEFLEESKVLFGNRRR